MATTVRKFTAEAGSTGRGEGKHRVNYGAAVRNNIQKLDRASERYALGVMSAREMLVLQMLHTEQALGATASGINSLTEGLNQLFGLSDKMIGAMKLASGSMQMTRAVISIYRVWTSAMEAKRAKELSLAMGETVAAMLAQNYAGIAFALSAVGVYSAAFGGGYMLGQHLHGGEVDISTSAGRRQVRYTLEGARP